MDEPTPDRSSLYFGVNSCAYFILVGLLVLLSVVLLGTGLFRLGGAPFTIAWTAALPMGAAMAITAVVRRSRRKGTFGRRRGLIPFFQERKNPFMAVWCTLFFGPLLLAGVGITVFVSAPTAVAVVKARDWIETPCAIRKTVSYPPNGGWIVRYHLEYTFDGKTYHSGRRDLMGGGRGDEMAHEPVRNRVCYLDPSNPSEAVLYRDLPGLVWAGPVMGVIAGTILFLVLRRRRPSIEP